MEIHLILFFMILAAIAAVEAKELISGVIGLSAVGLGLSLAFLILKAPNLAITQLVVEILAVVILIRATINKDLPLVRDGRWLFNTAVTGLFILIFLGLAYFALKELPLFGQPLISAQAEYTALYAKDNNFTNLVANIILNLRLTDSLGELAVLFTAIIGVLAITRRTGKIHEK